MATAPAQSADTGNKAATSARTDRKQIAGLVLWWSFILLGLATAAVIALVLLKDGKKKPDDLFELLKIVLPVISTWVGAVIAFYFARDNFDAAAENTRLLIEDISGKRLESHLAGDVMVPVDKLQAVNRPKEDADELKAVFKRFTDLRLTRLPVLEDGVGKGVLHEGVVQRYLAQHQDARKTVRDMLDDPETKEILSASTVSVGAGATLKTVKEAMDQKSKANTIRCRDVFVTRDGTETGIVIGYLADTDIARYGAYG